MKINFLIKRESVGLIYSLAIFRVSSVLFMVLFTADYLVPGIVTSWVNPIWILIVAMLSGILAVSQD